MSQSNLFNSFTKINHKDAYPAISPTLHAPSAAGKTVLTTGASQGIGLAIARALAAARFTHLILLARRLEALSTVSASLKAAHPTLAITFYPCRHHRANSRPHHLRLHPNFRYHCPRRWLSPPFALCPCF